MDARSLPEKIKSLLRDRIVRVYLDPDYEYPFIKEEEANEEEATTFIDGEVNITFSPQNTISLALIADPGDTSFFRIIPGHLIHAIVNIPGIDDEDEILEEEDPRGTSHRSGNYAAGNEPGLIN